MDLIKCPICGEEYSPSYVRCPFCEEDRRPGKPKRRLTTRKKAQSARGAMIAVLVLVLALLSWYLFGGKKSETPPASDGEPQQEQHSAEPAINTDPFYDPAETADPAGADEPVTPPEEVTPDEPDTPDVPPAAGVDASKLTLRSSVGALSREQSSGKYDCTIGRSDAITLLVQGTDVKPSEWKSDNTAVVKVDANGKLTPVASGKAEVTVTVGGAKLTCIVRVK